MFEKIIILLLFIILFVYIYIIKKYKNNITNDKKNILLFKYDYFSVKVFIYFLIPFYILGILAITIFWKTDSIDKNFGNNDIIFVFSNGNYFCIIYIKKENCNGGIFIYIFNIIFHKKN